MKLSSIKNCFVCCDLYCIIMCYNNVSLSQNFILKHLFILTLSENKISNLETTQKLENVASLNNATQKIIAHQFIPTSGSIVGIIASKFLSGIKFQNEQRNLYI